jgi:hypothetical protein
MSGANPLKSYIQRNITAKRKINPITSLAFQKALNVISLSSINFIKQYYILFLHSLKMLNLQICAFFEWLPIITNQILMLYGSNTFGRGGIFIVPHMLWHGTAPFSRLLHVQLVRRCVQPILTRIPMVHFNIHITILY